MTKLIAQVMNTVILANPIGIIIVLLIAVVAMSMGCLAPWSGRNVNQPQ
jgi:uncharacterized protein YacL